MDTTEKFIECVRKHSSLYDLRDKYYRNTTYKLRLWERIGRESNMTGTAAKNKWKTLRDGYMRYKKQVQGSTGSGRKSISYIWAEQLNFLDDSIQPRPSTSNVESIFSRPPQNMEDNGSAEMTVEHSSSLQLPQTTLTQNNLSANSVQNFYDTRTESPPTSPSNLNRTPSPTPRSMSSPTPRSISSPTPRSMSSPTPRSMSSSTPRSMSSPTPRSMSSPDPNTPHIKKKETDIEKAINYLKSKKKNNYDETDYLLLSYAKTLKKLPVPKQAELKIKLAQLFAEAELSEYSRTRETTSPSTLTTSPSTLTTSTTPYSNTVQLISSQYSIISDDDDDSRAAAKNNDIEYNSNPS